MLIDTIATTPYATLQKPMDEVKEKLLEYYRGTNVKLNYEYNESDKYQLVFITGLNENEINIGRFYLPIHFITATGKRIIFIDVRSCVNVNAKKDFTTLKEIVKDRALFDIKITHIGLICNYLDKEILDSEYMIQTIKIFSVVMTNLITNNLRLDIIDATDLKYILAYYYTSILFPNKEHDNKIILTAKAVANINKIDEIESVLQHIPDSITTTDNLLELIKKNVPNNRASKLNRTTLYLIVNSLLFGIETKQYLTVSLENGLIFMSLIYNGYNNRIFKRTAMFNILKTQNKYLDMKEFDSKVELYLKNFN